MCSTCVQKKLHYLNLVEILYITIFWAFQHRSGYLKFGKFLTFEKERKGAALTVAERKKYSRRRKSDKIKRLKNSRAAGVTANMIFLISRAMFMMNTMKQSLAFCRKKKLRENWKSFWSLIEKIFIQISLPGVRWFIVKWSSARIICADICTMQFIVRYAATYVRK